MKPGETTTTRERAPGLNGVRALAVLTVIGFHEGASGLRGGFLGVDIFFVLSGFLITDLLISKVPPRWPPEPGALRSWRARRLLPALAVMLVVVTAAAAVIATRPGGLAPRGAAGRGHLHEPYQILHHVSYFAAISQAAAPPPFDHLWSLAIEEQFYPVWPLIVLCVIVRWHARRARVICALTGAAVSALVMVIQYTPGGDPSAVYYGTDNGRLGAADRGRAGAGLAAAQAGGHPGRAHQAARHGRDRRAGLPAWAVGHFSGGDPVVYPVGLLLAALAAAGLIARGGRTRGHRRAHQHPAAALGRRQVVRDLPRGTGR